MTTLPVTKQQWRARLLRARSARTPDEVAAARERVAGHLLRELAGAGQTRRGGDPVTVCAYLPLPSEPLAPEVPALLAEGGLRVLLPVARPGAPLDWCALDPGGTDPADPGTARGMLGVAEPTGPRLGPAAIRTADVLLLPALAVDAAGRRLGRGGGHYDRSLALLTDEQHTRSPRLIAVVFDDECVTALPHERHDVPVTEVVTPAGGLRHVAPRAPHGASSI